MSHIGRNLVRSGCLEAPGARLCPSDMLDSKEVVYWEEVDDGASILVGLARVNCCV